MEKSDSPPVQQRSRVDSNTAASNAQANQTASQNVIWRCKKLANVNMNINIYNSI